MNAALAGRLRQWQDRRAPPAARVRLDHRRVYIVPSRAGWAFAFTQLLILLAAINYQNSMAYALVFTLGSMFVVAILHTYRNLSGLQVISSGAPPVFAGEQACFGVQLESGGRAHEAITAGWEGHPEGTLHIKPGHVQRLELPLPTRHRGWAQAPRLRLGTTYPLGLLYAWSWVRGGQQVLVYPQPLEGPLPVHGGATGLLEEQGLSVRGAGADDFQGLRPYQLGDTWRRVNWKAWSRGGPLLVKAFAEVRGQQLTLDFAAVPGDTEQRLSLLCYWALRLAREQRPFALHLPGLAFGPACDEAHCQACLRALALFGYAR